MFEIQVLFHLGMKISRKSRVNFDIRERFLILSCTETRLKSKTSKVGGKAHFEYYTEEQFTLLYERSIEIINKTSRLFVPMPAMCCDQPTAYWNRIRNHYDGFMIPYRKYFNGTNKSAINGKIPFLLFNASLHKTTQKLPTFSYFGHQRLMVNFSFIVNIHQNIYFADFYCHNVRNLYVRYYLLVVASSSYLSYFPPSSYRLPNRITKN
jgi:hypothetical protein